jgi:hypothetical protein
MLEWRRKTLAGKAGYHSEFAKIAGLVGSIETTKDGALDGSASGWHPHAHILVLHDERFEYSELQKEWNKITGDSHVVNVQACRNPEDPALDFLEIFKYQLKFGDLTPEENLDAYESLRSKRLLFSAGLFWGVDVPENLLDTPFDELPYVELLYRYLPGAGYSLAETIDSEVDERPKRSDEGNITKDMDYRRKSKKWSPYSRFEIPEDIIDRAKAAFQTLKG